MRAPRGQENDPSADYVTAVARAQRENFREYILLGVPAVIAIALVAAIISFWFLHPSDPIAVELIKLTLMAVLGYFVGSKRRR
jgi:hypothetical protein